MQRGKAGTLLILGFPIAVIVQARSIFVKSEAMLSIVETEEKSQKDRILTASKTIWMLTSWHKTLVPALGSELIMDV